MVTKEENSENISSLVPVNSNVMAKTNNAILVTDKILNEHQKRKLIRQKDNLVIYGANLQRTGFYSDFNGVHQVRSMEHLFKHSFCGKNSGCILTNPLVENGIVYLGTSCGMFYSIDIQSKKKLWHKEMEGLFWHGATICDEIIYFGCKDQYIYALDKKTGREIWKFKTIGAEITSPAINNGILFCVAHLNNEMYNDLGQHYATEWSKGYLYAIDSKSGKEIWKVNLGGDTFDIYRSATPAIYDNKLFINAGDRITAYHLISGTKIWESVKMKSPVSYPSVFDNKVYFVHSRTLSALDITSGNEVWRRNDVGEWLAIAHGIVCMTKWDNKTIVAFSSSTGELIWEFQIGHRISSKPAIADGIVYFGNYALELKTGVLLWKYDLEKFVPLNFPVVNEDRLFFICTKSWSHGNECFLNYFQ